MNGLKDISFFYRLQDSSPVGESKIVSFLRTNLPPISFFRKVAVVEEFYEIIRRSHVDEKGGHAGQKKTYRLVSSSSSLFLLRCCSVNADSNILI